MHGAVFVDVAEMLLELLSAHRFVDLSDLGKFFFLLAQVDLLQAAVVLLDFMEQCFFLSHLLVFFVPFSDFLLAQFPLFFQFLQSPLYFQPLCLLPFFECAFSLISLLLLALSDLELADSCVLFLDEF